MIIKSTELIMVEVNQNELSFFTETQLIKSVGKLKDIRLRLNLPNFIQISRFAIINMNYLQSIESGFSGTLVARLKGNVKTTVSRRYVPIIKQYLNL
nr:LytTR family DNA-binding domain-containing protein [Limosilactobacillus rudii]